MLFSYLIGQLSLFSRQRYNNILEHANFSSIFFHFLSFISIFAFSQSFLMTTQIVSRPYDVRMMTGGSQGSHRAIRRMTILTFC